MVHLGSEKEVRERERGDGLCCWFVDGDWKQDEDAAVVGATGRRRRQEEEEENGGGRERGEEEDVGDGQTVDGGLRMHLEVSTGATG